MLFAPHNHYPPHHLIHSVESWENILLHAHNVLYGWKANGKNQFDIRSKAFARRLLFFSHSLMIFIISLSLCEFWTFSKFQTNSSLWDNFVYELDANVCDTHNIQPELNKTFDISSTSAISNSISLFPSSRNNHPELWRWEHCEQIDRYG